nr:hypothetical protein [Tanacetum cinerariifolium]
MNYDNKNHHRIHFSHVQNDAMLHSVSKGTSSVMWKTLPSPVTHSVQPPVQPQFFAPGSKALHVSESSLRW